MLKRTLLMGASLIACTISTTANAQDHSHHTEHCTDGKHGVHHYAPIGVMGDHIMPKGKWMTSYRFMHMNMDGNRDGTDSLSPVEIATTIPNRFAATAGQPATLRIVPTKMTMDMHMFGTMYGLSDKVTLMAMANYQKKKMDHITFQGGAGTTERGRFSTQSNGWGDVKLSSLVRLYEDNTHHVHLNAGFSIPTGSIKKTATSLTPMGMTPRVRMPYSMQLGTGTYDLHPGLTYTGSQNKWAWGAQYKAEIRLEDENDQGYAWGDKHSLAAWGSYGWADWISTSARLTGTTQSKIDGIDPNILAPVQTADPDNYGGDTIELSLGVNLLGTKGLTKGHRLALEASAPLYRDLNGPQLETDYTFTIGWVKSF